MPVYIVRAGDSNRVKIGFTKNLWKRIEGIQTGNHQKVTVIRWIAGTMDDEKDLHGRFAHLRVSGEWYRFSSEMAGDLGLPDLPLPPRPSVRQWNDHPLAQYLVKRGLTQSDFGKMIDTSQSAISKWLIGVRMPRPAQLRRILVITNGSVTPNDFLPPDTGAAA